MNQGIREKIILLLGPKPWVYLLCVLAQSNTQPWKVYFIRLVSKHRRLTHAQFWAIQLCAYSSDEIGITRTVRWPCTLPVRVKVKYTVSFTVQKLLKSYSCWYSSSSYWFLWLTSICEPDFIIFPQWPSMGCHIGASHAL